MRALSLTIFSTVTTGLAVAASLSHAAAADPPLMNVLVRALIDGRARSPALEDAAFQPSIAAMQKQAGDPGPIFIEAMRIVRFTAQARCGRVVFGMSQPSSHKAWPGMGGQLNICEDGQPPLRVCRSRPNVMVPATSVCADKSAPVDTPEVAAAIAKAIAEGGTSQEQARQALQATVQERVQAPGQQSESASGSGPGRAP